VDLPVVSGQKGLVIAHALLETLKHQSLTVEDIKQQLVGGAMDDRYFMLHVPTHLLTLIGLHDSPWNKFNCDPVHCVELSEGDARTSSQWVSGLGGLIHRLQKDGLRKYS
jgi:hypothetical protein